MKPLIELIPDETLLSYLSRCGSQERATLDARNSRVAHSDKRLCPLISSEDRILHGCLDPRDLE